MLTLFTCPKPFRGHIDIIQRNAIRSWTKLAPKPEIILLGDEEGTARTADELGVDRISRVMRNEFGTPLVNSLFEEAEKAATYDRMCYINTDIILMSDFMHAIQRVSLEKPQSLMVGQRWNLDIREPLEFGANWEERLTTQVVSGGKLYPHFAIDYFVFPKGIWGQIPPFAIGRPAWDNWILYRAHSRNIPVIDLTEAVIVVHQNHDYSHHPQGWRGAMKGEESKQNIELAGEIGHVYSLLDAQYRLTRKGVERKVTPYYSPYYIYQVLVRLSESHRLLKPLVRLIRMIGDRFLSRPVKF